MANGTPTSTNPVITQTSPEERLRRTQAGAARLAERRATAQTPAIEPPRIETPPPVQISPPEPTARVTAPTAEPARRGRVVPRGEFEDIVRAEESRADLILGRGPAAEEASRQSRAFFNRLQEQGVSQQELVNLTGARDATAARDLIQAGEFQDEFERLVGDKAIEKRRGELQTEEEKIRADIKAAFEPQFASARRAGAQAKESAFRIQGRAAEGSKSFEQQEDLAERQGLIEQSIAAQQRLEERRAIALARGATSEEVEGINLAIGAARKKREDAQTELELVQSGLDNDAIKLANERGEFNTKIMLDALKAGFEFDPETQTFSEAPGGVKQNLQFVAPKFDDFGNMLTPAYTFDKSTGSLNLLDTTSGLEQGLTPETTVQYGAPQTFANFEQYTKGTGTGQVIGGSPYHSGLELDIDGAIGDPVLSFAGGKVVSVEDTGDRGFGKNVIIENEDGIRIRYAHLDDFNVKEGQLVPAGALIGPMGATGSVIAGPGGDGSHLHIEARDRDNKLVNLQDIRSESSRISPNDINQLRALAFQSGYVSNDEVMGFINAVKNGVQPPDKQALDMDDRDFNRANTLRDEFDNKAEVKEFKAVQIATDSFKGILDSGVKGPADLALVFKFMKALDPNSVVRESEFDAAAGSGSMFKGAWTKFNGKFDEGQFLSDEIRNDFLRITQEALKSKKKGYDAEVSRFGALADKSGVDRDFVIFDYSEGIEDILAQPRTVQEGTPASELSTRLGISKSEVESADAFLDF